MKAIQLEQPKSFRMIEIDEPAKPGPGEALVRVHRVGICGSDISGYLGKMPFYSYPRIPGHELGVEVLAVAADVDNVGPGQTCSVEPYINNPNSFASRRGHSNCCEEVQVLGVHTDGGLRPRFIVPARKLHPSSKLTLDQLALVETLAIGCHAVNRADVQFGENALVIGAGPIGLSAIEFLKLRGAKITVLDLNEGRLAFCKKTMRVAHTIQALGDGSELKQMAEITGGSLFTAVFDATGSPQSMSNALNYVAHTGRLVYLGIVTSEISFPDPLFHRREMTLLATRNALPHEFRFIIEQIEQEKIDTRPWITHRVPFDGLIEAFPTLIKPETGVIKAIVELP
jgi:2-desacetyl-2-hydroxyethyl bacteriochlorophyllide A dehydrogenase